MMGTAQLMVNGAMVEGRSKGGSTDAALEKVSTSSSVRSTPDQALISRPATAAIATAASM